MARRAARSELSAAPRGFVPDWARNSDDAELRRLLRETPMDGRIRISLEREPDFFRAAEIEGDLHHTGVARDPSTGEILGMCTRAVREAWVNGELARLGYLSQLRVARGRVRVSRELLRFGFEGLRASHRPDEAAFDVTTIVSDNAAARRLLEFGLRGLPRYRMLEPIVTFMIPVRRRFASPSHPGERGCAALAPRILACLQRNARRHQFAPHWSERNMCARGLRWEDFHLVTDSDRVVGCLARWDQRRFKQAVVRGYGSFEKLSQAHRYESLFTLSQ
jgi:hypothetical protein